MTGDDGRTAHDDAGSGLTTLPPGTRVDRYEIERLIAAGGFGITYMARHVGLNKRVALKEHFPRGFASRDAATHTVAATNPGTFEWTKERFLKEGEALTRCKHPGVVDALDVFEANGTAYMALGYEDGQSLGAWLKGLGRFATQAELDRILHPLLDALAYVHMQDMLHRDLAPDNIIIRRDGSPVLIDFGAARQAIAQRSQIMSAIVKGGFSPPEQYTTTGKAQGPWSDIYALGATLHYALTSRMVEESTSRTVEDSYRPVAETLGSRSRDYRPAFLAAIDQALKIQRADRPQDIGAWRQSLFADATQAAVPTLSTMPTVALSRHAPQMTATSASVRGADAPNVPTVGKPWALIAAGGVGVTLVGAWMMARAFTAPPQQTLPAAPPKTIVQPTTAPPVATPPVIAAPPTPQISPEEEARRKQLSEIELLERKAAAERRIAEDRAAQLKAEADAKKLADAKAAETDAEACGRLPEDMCVASSKCSWVKPTVFIEGRPVWPARCAPKGARPGGVTFEGRKH